MYNTVLDYFYRVNIAHKEYRFIAAVILLHVFYFFLAFRYGNIYNGDSFEYIQEAVNIKDHLYFYCGNLALPFSAEYLTLRPPGYPLFIALFYCFSINNWLIIFVQNIFSVFNVLYCRKIFSALGYSIGYDFFLFLLLLFYPSQFVYANLMAPDLLLQTCSVIYFANMVNYLKNKTVKSVLMMSFFLALALFIKPVFYPFVVIHFIVLLALGIYNKQLKTPVIIAAIFPLLCVVSYSQLNKLRTGKFHFSSIQSFNAIYYYQRYFTDNANAEEGKKFIDHERAEIEMLPTFKERYERANNRGISLLKQNFASYTFYHLKKSCLFFLETGRGELDEFTGNLTLKKVYDGQSKKFMTIVKEQNFKDVIIYLKTHQSAMLALCTLLFNMLKLIGVMLFFKLAKLSAIIKWFIALYLLYFALLTGPISNAHYVMPVSLIIILTGLNGFYFFEANRKSIKTV